MHREVILGHEWVAALEPACESDIDLLRSCSWRVRPSRPGSPSRACAYTTAEDASVTGNPGLQHDSQTTGREERAERYFEQDLAGQLRWYSDKATRYKERARLLGVSVIGAGAATAFLQVFGAALWVPVLTALLGA